MDYRHALVCALLAPDEETLRAELRRIIEDMEDEHALQAIEESEEVLRLGNRAAAIAPTLDWSGVGALFTGAIHHFDGERDAYIWVDRGSFGFRCGGLAWRYNAGHIREPEHRARVLALKAKDYLSRRSRSPRPRERIAETLRFRERSVRALFAATRWALED